MVTVGKRGSYHINYCNDCNGIWIMRRLFGKRGS
ncbi:MAG: hypothetical protein GXY86_07700 [Firmicutes bacterium]|nr:hypothetical protein [Bacillota bacterium]